MPASVLQGSIFHQAGRVSRAPEDKGGDWRSPAHAAPSAPFALSPHWGGGNPTPSLSRAGCPGIQACLPLLAAQRAGGAPGLLHCPPPPPPRQRLPESSTCLFCGLSTLCPALGSHCPTWSSSRAFQQPPCPMAPGRLDPTQMLTPDRCVAGPPPEDTRPSPSREQCKGRSQASGHPCPLEGHPREARSLRPSHPY